MVGMMIFHPTVARWAGWMSCPLVPVMASPGKREELLKALIVTKPEVEICRLCWN